jgi:hypothetical protein
MSDQARLATSRPLLSGAELFIPRTPILSAGEAARLMGCPSSEALTKARQTGRLPIPMFQIPGRRGWFAATHVVKAWLEQTLAAHGGVTEPEEGQP